MFLRNAWYVAAWDDEVTRTPSHTSVLGEPICLYRDGNAKPVALEDACPHRKLPLSMGRVKGSNVECGYHGLTFDRAGRCVAAPGKGEPPRGAAVRAYPVVERYGLVWIWMGPPDAADTDAIFEVEHYDDPAWGLNRGPALEMRCHYLYVTDNLLDPTHVAWVHPSSFGEDSARDTPLTIDVGPEGVTVHRWMLDCEPAPFYKKVVPFEGRCDRLQHYEVRYPSHAIIKAVFTPAGTGGASFAQNGNNGDRAFLMDSYNFMTPMSETETRYYWFQLRNIRPRDESLSRTMTEGVLHAFEEDRVILNAVQIGMDSRTAPNINLPIDAGPLRFRRELAARIEAERAPQKGKAS